jgi:hypothetical protein
VIMQVISWGQLGAILRSMTRRVSPD